MEIYGCNSLRLSDQPRCDSVIDHGVGVSRPAQNTISARCPLYPPKRTLAAISRMSAKGGHKRTHAPQQKASLFDHLVGNIRFGAALTQLEGLGSARS